MRNSNLPEMPLSLLQPLAYACGNRKTLQCFWSMISVLIALLRRIEQDPLSW